MIPKPIDRSKYQILDMKNIDQFKPKLYADLYIPSYITGQSIAMDFVYDWFLDKFPDDHFKSIFIVDKFALDEYRKYNLGDRIKREKPSLSIKSVLEYDYSSEYNDLKIYGIDSYIKKTDFQRSFFKDIKNKRYLGFETELMVVNFGIRLRYSTRAQQLDMFKRMEMMFRTGFTETRDIDVDFHVPYELMADLAKDVGFEVNENGIIKEPYAVLKYLNAHSQIPFMYKLRFINAKYEYFIRMTNIPLHLDNRERLSIDEGEQEGQLFSNFHIDMNLKVRILVPKFYLYYAEGKTVNELKLGHCGLSVYSMKLFDLPEYNDKGWILFATTDYIKDKEDSDVINEIDISSMFKARFNIDVGHSLDDLIDEAISREISPNLFIDIQVYSRNNILSLNGKIASKIDWKNKKILLDHSYKDNYLHIAIYTERKYINDKIIELTNGIKHRVQESKQEFRDESKDKFIY